MIRTITALLAVASIAGGAAQTTARAKYFARERIIDPVKEKRLA